MEAEMEIWLCGHYTEKIMISKSQRWQSFIWQTIKDLFLKHTYQMSVHPLSHFYSCISQHALWERPSQDDGTSEDWKEVERRDTFCFILYFNIDVNL